MHTRLGESQNPFLLSLFAQLKTGSSANWSQKVTLSPRQDAGLIKG